MRIREARFDDIPALREIERAAGALFREIGMLEIADDEPFPIEVLSGYVAPGRAWAAVVPDTAMAGPGMASHGVTDSGVESSGVNSPGLATGGAAGFDATSAAGVDEAPVQAEPVGYLVADILDGNVHIEQVSVHPRFSRRGIGRLLIDRASAYAVSVDAPALTLATFVDVGWNAPYYRRCGFEAMDDAAIGPQLRAVREHEASAGLDRWPRVCMRRPVRPAVRGCWFTRASVYPSG